MRILYLYQYFGTPRGGWSTRAYEHARRWVQAGHEVCVISSLYDKSDLTATGLWSRYRIEGIQVYALNLRLSNKHGFFRRLYNFGAYALAAGILGSFLRADLILASSGPITVGVPGLFLHRLKHCPLVFEVRDLWPEGAVALGILRGTLWKKLAYAFEGQCYRASRLVVTCSERARQSIRQRYPDVRVVNIPNASDLDLFRYRPAAPNGAQAYRHKALFVYTGTLGLIDHCVLILEAAAHLCDPHIHILLIGDGRERKQLQAFARAKGLLNVTFLGQLPKPEVVGYLREATAALLTVLPIPFMDHCSPNKLFDAFAAKMPVIQNSQGWIRELIAREECGITVPRRDSRALARAMTRLAEEPATRDHLAAQAARLGRTRFNRDRLAWRLLRAMEDLG
jgi:glycosyltransferase involved in cell wall biosynthesis